MGYPEDTGINTESIEKIHIFNKEQKEFNETYLERETNKHISRVQHFIFIVIKELLDRVERHDRSKLEDPEREGFLEYTPKLRRSTYGSDEYKEFLKCLKPFLDHHYEFNQHHPEHFEDGILGMNLIDILEMLCDWRAATERHADGNIRKSIEINQDRFGYSDDIKKILENTVNLLENQEQKSKEDV